jgi:DNA-binding beta-propeller fold protein YncE
MNEQRFDGIARILGTHAGRRALAGGLASLLAGLTIPQSALACKKVGKKCDKSKDCCDGATCKGGKHGKCKCKSGFTTCNTKCYDLDRDEDHCGGCGNACQPDEFCEAGTCVPRGYAFAAAWGQAGSGFGQFDGPTAIALAPNGDIFVTDAYNHRVQVFTAEGIVIYDWGTAGTANGEIWVARGIAITDQREFFVTDGGDRVQEFDGGGNFQHGFGGFGHDPGELVDPWGIGIGEGGDLFVADPGNDRVQRFTQDGVFVLEWGGSGSGHGQLDGPCGLAIAPDGDVYVAEQNNFRVQRFRPDGTFVLAFGSQGSGDGEFGLVQGGLKVDADGDVFVADVHNHRIQKFDADGHFLLAFGSQGSGNGELSLPQGIAVDADGNVLVADAGNQRIQMFAPI